MHSVVARWIGLEAAKPTGRAAIRGMATFAQSHPTVEKKMVQIWGKGVRAGYIPCTDKQVYWFITRKSQPQGNFSHMIYSKSTSVQIRYYAHQFELGIMHISADLSCDEFNSTDADVSLDPENLRCAALEVVRDFPKPIKELIKSSSADMLNVAKLKLRWVWPWKWDKMAKAKGSVMVVGDALHPMTPDLGQGACSALDDVVVLARCLYGSHVNLEDIHWVEEDGRIIEE